MEDKFQKRYRISSPRLEGWDYGSHGLYFVTICTKDRIPFFGEIIQTDISETAMLRKAKIAEIASDNWLKIGEFHPYVIPEDFVVMPDHLHGILFFNKPDKTTWETNKFGGQRNNLASVLRGYKGSVKQYADRNNIEFSWQPRYYDRVIRDKKEHENIQGYIYDNPGNWLLNKHGFENLYL
ncbi:transposase [Mucilaginibacter sp. NFX135]|uniref:transposase n=1 Tax=Mucilaginibacter sp. NFX135 TaxID=3402687 RepID=UPI003AFACA4D